MILVQTRKWNQDFDPYHIGYAAEYTANDARIVAELTKRGNVLSDPGLADVAGGDYSLNDDSPALRVGFQKSRLIISASLWTNSVRQ